MRYFPSYFATFFLLFTSVCACAAEVNAFKLSENTHIRTLAASCAACHGTFGNAAASNATSGNAASGNAAGGNSVGSLPELAGLDASYFAAQMNAFKNGERASTVMHHHAKGLHADEIDLLALYFSQQKRVTAPTLKSQVLKENHE